MTSVVTKTSPSKALRHRYARRIYEWRTEAGLTQQALGAAAGLHRVYVGRFESGEVNFSLDSLEKLLRVLVHDKDPRPLTERLAKNLKRHRGKMSQESFASALGLPVLFISRLERQVVTTTIDQVDRLAQIMRIDGETLLY